MVEASLFLYRAFPATFLNDAEPQSLAFPDYTLQLNLFVEFEMITGRIL